MHKNSLVFHELMTQTIFALKNVLCSHADTWFRVYLICELRNLLVTPCENLSTVCDRLPAISHTHTFLCAFNARHALLARFVHVPGLIRAGPYSVHFLIVLYLCIIYSCLNGLYSITQLGYFPHCAFVVRI